MKPPLLPLLACLLAAGFAAPAQNTLQTAQARIGIDEKGFVTSLMSLQTGKEYSPAGHPSPLLSLHEGGQPYGRILLPTRAAFDAGRRELTLSYPNGATAVVQAVAKADYFRFQLVSLTPRGTVDNIVWGPLHTTVSKKIGDLLGIVRDDDWAVGMLGLDDNTIAGPPADGDCAGAGYYIHSPDPKRFPVPPQYHEGERFGLGGNGISDVAFYSHPEEYFQAVSGSGAILEPEFGSTVAFHARDRRNIDTNFWSLLPDFNRSRPRHQVTDPVAADFTGSAVAWFACPDAQGLQVIENIILAEGLPHPVIDGKWVHDATALKPDITWHGPHDKLIEYVDALGLDGCSCQDEGQGEYYANPADHWQGERVGFTGGRCLTYREFTDECRRHGISYGLHTLCLFLQPGRCTDVSPVASEHLQTVCRTKLAADISAADTNIVVTDPSFLAEHGTWPDGDDGNYLRIGGELVGYDGVSATAPFTLKGVTRGHASQAAAHQAGDEVVKLQQNCYQGFCPDLTLMPKYADYYAQAMVENGMSYVDFDGLESTLYLNQGYYGVRTFFRRFFATYARLTGGRAPRVMGAGVIPGGWEYVGSCNVGGNNNMFDPVNNRWGTEGKDVRNGFGNSYFPPTFGIQDWHANWSVYDAENLEAKSIGWNATYMLGLSQAAVENCGEKDAIFQAYRCWEKARAAGAFTPELKRRLRDPGCKFHIEPAGENNFVVHPVREIRAAEAAGNVAASVALSNPQAAQPLQFALQVDEAVSGLVITLPDGSQMKSGRALAKGQFILCRGNSACVTDHNRNPLAGLELPHAGQLPAGESRLGVQFPGAATPVRFNLTVWTLGTGVKTGA